MQFWNCTPFCKGKTGHPSNLRWIFLGLPPWVILSWFWCIIIIPVFLRFHFLLPNPPHSIAACPTNPIHLIDSTTSQLVSWSLSCQKFLGNFLALGRGEFPVQILWSPYYLVSFPSTTISSLALAFFDISVSFGWPECLCQVYHLVQSARRERSWRA